MKCKEIQRKHVFVTICLVVALGLIMSMKGDFGYNTSIKNVVSDVFLVDNKETGPTNINASDVLRAIIENSLHFKETVSTQTPTFRLAQQPLINVKCSDTSNKKVVNFFGKIKSDMSKWSFQEQIECPENIIGNISKRRRKLSIQCSNDDDVKNWYSYKLPPDNVETMEFGDSCLDRYIQKCCMHGKRIPNVIHYVWYMRGELNFVPFLSLLSAIRFVKPCVIVFHGQSPYGKYWDAFIHFWPNVVILKRDRPEVIFGQRLKHKEHSSDMMRIEALIHYGGIYMDTDTLLVKPIDVLRQYPCVMSNQSSGLMGSAFVMSEKNGSFVQKWMDGYKYHYFPQKYAYNAMVYPLKLVRNPTNKGIIHIEYGTVSRPIGRIGGLIYYNNYTTTDWSYIYGIHLYSRIYKHPVNETTIRQMNTTFGSICRHIYYGNKELCL